MEPFSLDRRLRHFNIYKTGKNVSVQKVHLVSLEEISRLGRFLGYRAMHVKIQQYYPLNVARALAYAAMEDVHLNGLGYRTIMKKRKKEKERFTSEGADCFFSLMAMRSSKVSKKVPSRSQYRAAIIQLVEN